MQLLSVVIPVKNGEFTLNKCLQAIKQQTLADNVEIIILDSTSTDNSRQIAESFATRIIHIPNGTFNHGLTRNLGMKYSTGDLIYFTVQDAYLADNEQLEKMTAYFTDKEVQSVTGIQAIPADTDKNPALWFKRFSKAVPEARQFAGNSFQDLSAKKQLEHCDWDNVNAMYRKSALQILPFQKTDFAEDALWARDALMRGWKIVRDSSLVVFHYHHQTFSYNFKTTFIINYTFWKHFNIMPAIPLNLQPVARNIYTLLKREKISFYRKTLWIFHNCIRGFAHTSSVIIFRSVYLAGKQKLLDKAYNHFCSVIPQGILKK